MSFALDRLRVLRAGGNVVRFHTNPTARTQTVAEHSFFAAQLLLQFYPEADRSLLLAVLDHDLPEGLVGDVPFPAKRDFPELNAALDRAEASVAQKWHFASVTNLTSGEQLWLRLVDLLECLWWAYERVKHGDSTYHLVMRNCIPGIASLTDTIERDTESCSQAESEAMTEVRAFVRELFADLNVPGPVL